MVAPLPTARLVQVLDVRDAAAFAVLCAQDSLGGVWNLNGEVVPMNDLFTAIHATTSSKGEIRWIFPDAFAAPEANPWTDVPLMAPDIPALRHFLEVDVSRARAAGLFARPLMETLVPLVEWDRTRRDVKLICGMNAKQEKRVLEEVC